MWPAVAAPAFAQIYSWRDSSGAVILSDNKPGEEVEVRTFKVEGAVGFKTTRPADAPTGGDARPTYDDLISEHAANNGVQPALVRAVIQVESGFNPSAISVKGAMGLMQLMPDTAAELGVFKPFDPEENIRGGVTYLRRLLDRYDGNEELALAAYNAGPAAVDRYGRRVPPYRETRNYVQKIRNTSPVSVAPSGPPQPPRTIYRVVQQAADGREVVLFTGVKPVSGEYTIVRTR